jgi:low affinity Fe/Cu permease
MLAALVIAVWVVTGPLFGFSDTWQLVINTGTTIITFLMVFLIQSTQNRDSEAVQVKLDEIIRAIGNAKNELLDLEELEEKDLDEIRQTYREMAEKARESGRRQTAPGADSNVRRGEACLALTLRKRPQMRMALFMHHVPPCSLTNLSARSETDVHRDCQGTTTALP